MRVNGSTWCGDSFTIPGYDRLRKFRNTIIINIPRLKSLEERTLKTVLKWLNRCKNPVVSFSCGKDSVVIADLALQLKPDIVMARHSSAEPHLPDVEQMMAYMEEYYPGQTREFVFGSMFEFYRKYGLEDTRIDRHYKQQVEKWEKEQGIDGALRGVRAEESRDRKNLRQFQGRLRRQNGIWVCDPIIDWTAEDVWSYIAWKGLPYCALYDIDDERPRNMRRLGSLWGTSAKNMGRLIRLKRHYPEFFDIFAREFPEVKKYV